ncbi:ATP-binding cassette domain-containing protein [Desulfotruncus alcoholivorax]|uniref:hypothetical protein n=1 Tax=Desulfotruncus alcoholivorax TaxID=265477 RepID=UPI00283A9F4F|nr:hypothetical protein [Desulfotruncus alcoholivorax]
MLNAIAGVIPLDLGRIILDGKEIQCQREHIRAGSIGRLFHDPMMGAAASMTIEENRFGIAQGEAFKL